MARERRLQPWVAAIAALLALLTVDSTVAGAQQAKAISVGLLAVVAIAWVSRLAKSWTALVTAMMLIALLVPSDGRYVLPNGPVRLEPYRVALGLLLIGWIIALLVDPRVRLRATGFEGPLMLIVCATVGSDLLNPTRVSELSSSVIKETSLFAGFVLFLYLVVSVMRTRRSLDRLIVALVSAGCLVALAAILQQRTHFNVFNHLHAFLPGFEFNPAAVGEGTNLERGGSLRATASAGTPIELSASMAMLAPLAVYLAVSRRQRAWWLAVGLLLLGDFGGGSRTGIIGVVVVTAIFLWLHPRETLRLWPALIPLAVVVHIAAPGALGGVIENFFPKGGVVAQQSETFYEPTPTGGKVVLSSRLSRIGPAFKEFSEHNALVGEGYGTRVTGRTTTHATSGLNYASAGDNAVILDDQWLGTLLETGLLGVAGWIWLFGRAIRRLALRSKLEGRTPDSWLGTALAASIAAFAASMLFYDAFAYDQATEFAFALIALAAAWLKLPPSSDDADEEAG